MLHITIPATEQWDEARNEFICTNEQTLQLEHSLVSLSKWESKWCKPFLTKEAKTEEETRDYIRCMTINQDVDPNVYYNLTNANIAAINNYISAPMTATTFSKEQGGKANREIVTSELIYYWMVALQIPPEYQYWHLNRLMTLIRVCEIKNAPPKKMGRRELMSRNAKINAARRQRLNTTG